MKYIDSKGNTKLISVSERSDMDLWNQLTNNGELWEDSGESMGNNLKSIVVAEYKGQLIVPLYDCYSTSCEFKTPVWEAWGGWVKYAKEAEVSNNELYLRQELTINNDYPTAQIVERFSLQQKTYPAINESEITGTYKLDWDSSSATNSTWDEFKTKYSFLEEFGGDTSTTAPIDDITDNRTGSFESIALPEKFKRKFVDKITNFDPSIDTLEIDIDSFGVDRSPTFAIGKNKKKIKKKRPKQDFKFLFGEKKGRL